MDLHDFDRSFGVGFSVSLEERAALETEMHKRQVEEKLARWAWQPLRVVALRTAGAPAGCGSGLGRIRRRCGLPPAPHCSIKFWGKVTGTMTDYIVVCGLTSLMETPQKKFYFA